MGATNIFLIGANSGIAQASLQLWARQGARAYLVARDAEKLSETVAAFRAAGGKVVGSETMDFNDPDELDALMARGFEALGQVDCFYLASGILPDHRVLEQSPETVEAVLRINLSVPAQILMHAANRLEDQGYGCLAALSSVAGEVGRRGNYVYGATKSGLSALMEGLDARFVGTPIRALDIRPGPVKTVMLAHLKPGLFFAEPEAVGRRIFKAIESGKRGCLYTPAYWRCIMSVIRHLPSVLRRRINV